MKITTNLMFTSAYMWDEVHAAWSQRTGYLFYRIYKDTLSYIGQQHFQNGLDFSWLLLFFALQSHLLKEIIEINTSRRFSHCSHFAAAAIVYKKVIFCKVSSCAQNPREMFSWAQCSTLWTIGPFQANFTHRNENPTNWSSCHQLPPVRTPCTKGAEQSHTGQSFCTSAGHKHGLNTPTTASAGHGDFIWPRVKEGWDKWLRYAMDWELTQILSWHMATS